ncbi:NAD-glutamate dehydrogenase [Halopseudomonas pachastrellae]|nr:NAD-glutamate dehydrogenase [Halopseudomonas pachastrellae]
MLHRDLPFLVDSVRMELTRQGYAIHNLYNSIVHVERDQSGNLKKLLAPGAQAADARAESVMYIEIDRATNASDLSALQNGLLAALDTVRAHRTGL